ncbi:unnamed protein product [Protopolystoma xenopodis]|uniref:Uncharacterized protein n=1 Tax=Protopolystoma xenopodis TaxID=117903 RepID=A0A448WK97_9PLAT|nr:unnamed protein product [Protopolystoma xenopodis]
MIADGVGLLDRPEYQAYRLALHELREGREAQAAAILNGQDALERNLVAVLINRPNFILRKVEEKEVLSLTGLLSQTGGLLSIWIGLTMISLGELAELIVRCVAVYQNCRDQRRLDAANQSSPACANTPAQPNKQMATATATAMVTTTSLAGLEP